MQVTFKRTAFIDGVRYRAGVHTYTGKVEDLPSDALIDGKPIEGRKAKDEPKASNVTAADKAAVRKEIEAAVRKDIEADIRAQVEKELRADEKFREKLLEELRAEQPPETVDPETAETAAQAGPFSKDTPKK